MTDTYPHHPGAKARQTSFAAADAIAARVPTLREQVLAAILAKPGTPEQIAIRTGIPLLTVRPRTSELSRMGLIEDSGRRDASQGGKRAIIWRGKVQA